MIDNMIELKKDALRQAQSGDWKASFTLQAADMPDYLLTSPMGKRFYVVFVDADDYDESNGTPRGEYFPNGSDIAKSYGIDDPVTRFTVDKREQTEGEKLRTRAAILCNERAFEEYCYLKHPTPLDAIRFQMNAHKCGVEKARCICVVYKECNIKSRSELATNIDAQAKFKELDQKFKDWQYEQSHAENLGRY